MKRLVLRCGFAAAVMAGGMLLAAAPANAAATGHTNSHDEYSMANVILPCGDHTLAVTGGTEKLSMQSHTDALGGWHYTQTIVYRNVTLTDELGTDYVLSGTSSSQAVVRNAMTSWDHGGSVLTVRYADGGGVAGKVRIWSSDLIDAAGDVTSTYISRGSCSGFDWP
ncbi:MAG TPA: hypothetical protein VJR25_07300 [Microbacterium sp.]|uniref:hypothetical protein n=1 Tax=Microbacterium sp. TaxID=51671 RepID=UPI002B48C857|nr:hypothetical protein [Microbacterium sp.]HKT56560.1 hypothetical protein [Microbacterium sp.]